MGRARGLKELGYLPTLHDLLEFRREIGALFLDQRK